jgi:hypothetical protein
VQVFVDGPLEIRRESELVVNRFAAIILLNSFLFNELLQINGYTSRSREIQAFFAATIVKKIGVVRIHKM